MKAKGLKAFVGLFAVFATYYIYFLYSVYRDLLFPAPDRFCGTGDFWALQAAATYFAIPALLGSAGLWFVGRQGKIVGVGFSRISRVEMVILILCSLANFVVFIHA